MENPDSFCSIRLCRQEHLSPARLVQSFYSLLLDEPAVSLYTLQKEQNGIYDEKNDQRSSGGTLRKKKEKKEKKEKIKQSKRRKRRKRKRLRIVSNEKILKKIPFVCPNIQGGGVWSARRDKIPTVANSS